MGGHIVRPIPILRSSISDGIHKAIRILVRASITESGGGLHVQNELLLFCMKHVDSLEVLKNPPYRRLPIWIPFLVGRKAASREGLFGPEVLEEGDYDVMVVPVSPEKYCKRLRTTKGILDSQCWSALFRRSGVGKS